MSTPLRGLLALAAMALPLAAQAAPFPKAASASVTAPSLTLYAEPGLKGRHATYRSAARNIERQGFVARSALATGMWTLCEGDQVVSRCQTVRGRAPELKLEPQIVRPGLNALALYDQPGLRGSRIIYSFPADRPAPFHARSARTWGGAWSICARGYHDCRLVDGKSGDLDMVVGAVKPDPQAPTGDPAEPEVLKIRSASQAESTRPIARLIAVHERRTAPVRARSVRVKAPAARPLHAAPRMLHVSTRHSLTPPHRHGIEHAGFEHAHRDPSHVRGRAHGFETRPLQRSRLIAVRARRRAEAAMHDRRELRTARFEHPQHHAPRAHLIADRHGRNGHAAHRKLYRRTRLLWGGSDPYLY